MTTQSEKAREQYELFEFCRVEGGHDTFLRNNEIAKRYYASKHWSDDDYNKRTGEGRLSFVVNEIFRTINAVRGELNQLTSDVRFDPTNGDPATAKVLNRLHEHTDRQNKIYMHDDRVLLDGLLGGRGYWRQNVVFDENMQGHVKIQRFRPENVIIDTAVDSPDTDTWSRVFTTEVVSAADIKRMFGKTVSDEFIYAPHADWLSLTDRTLAQSIGAKAIQITEEGKHAKCHRLINQQYRDYKYKDCFIDQTTGDFSEIPESWSPEKVSEAIRRFGLGTMRRKIDTIRWRVTCNNYVLFDEDSAYKHFDIVPFFPWLLDDLPISLFEALRGPQDLFNYTVSEETYILGNTAHSGWKVKQGSLKNMTSRDLEKKGGHNNLVMELDEIADAERITPGQPAAGFAAFGNRAREWVTSLGSATPSMLGQQSQYANGQNIAANLQRAPVNLHAPLLAFQYSKQMIAEHRLALFQAFYTETRVLRVATSSYGEAQPLGINVPDEEGNVLYDLSVGKYAVRLMPVGSRQAAEEFGFDQLKYMKEAGINVPNSLFVATSALNAKSDVIEQLLEANNGELSPEEQRLRELEVEQAELALVDAKAGIEAKSAAAELARGRAVRARMDASFDPRTARAALDEKRLLSEHERGQRQITSQETRDARNAAVQVAKLAVDSAKEPAGVDKSPKPFDAKKASKKAPKKPSK